MGRYNDEKETESKEELSSRSSANNKYSEAISTPPRQQEPSKTSAALRPSFPPRSSLLPGNAVRNGGGMQLPTNQPESLSIVGTNKGGAVPAPRKDSIQQRHQNDFKQQFLEKAKLNTRPLATSSDNPIPSSSSSVTEALRDVHKVTDDTFSKRREPTTHTPPSERVRSELPGNHDPDHFGGEISAAAMAEMLDSMLESSSYTVSELTQRLATLKTLRAQWEKGDIIQVISLLQVISDEALESNGDESGLVVLADFLQAIELKGNGLNLDACVSLLPIFESIISKCMRIEHVIKAAVNSTTMLLEAFGDLIVQTRAINVMGVDLSREERLKKCNRCWDSLCGIRKKLDILNRQYGKKQTSGATSSIVNICNKLIGVMGNFGIA